MSDAANYQCDIKKTMNFAVECGRAGTICVIGNLIINIYKNRDKPQKYK